MTEKYSYKYEKIFGKLIKEAESVAVLTHIHADGDALGSAFSLGMALADIGKKVTVFLNDEIEEPLQFMKPDGLKQERGWDYETVIYSRDTDIEKYSSRKYDLAISVDIPTRERMGVWETVFNNADRTMKIDHHQTMPEHFTADAVAINTQWASCSEGIWILFRTLGIKPDYEIALRVYTGIMTDTGRFIYSSVTPETLKIASEVVEIAKGDLSWIARNVYDLIPRQRVELLADVYSRTEFFADGKIAYLYLNAEDFERTGTNQDDTNSFSSIMRNIEGVEVSIFVRDSLMEKPDSDGSRLLKVSMRSSEQCDVAKVASEFSGGGHLRAAGLSYTGFEKDLKIKLTESVKKQLENG